MKWPESGEGFHTLHLHPATCTRDSGGLSQAPRIGASRDTMIANATKGKNAMPPMGTCMVCSADDIAALVDYMVSKSQ